MRERPRIKTSAREAGWRSNVAWNESKFRDVSPYASGRPHDFTSLPPITIPTTGAFRNFRYGAATPAPGTCSSQHDQAASKSASSFSYGGISGSHYSANFSAPGPGNRSGSGLNDVSDYSFAGQSSSTRFIREKGSYPLPESCTPESAGNSTSGSSFAVKSRRPLCNHKFSTDRTTSSPECFVPAGKVNQWLEHSYAGAVPRPGSHPPYHKGINPTSPAFNMGAQRIRCSHRDRGSSPGPGMYNHESKQKSPASCSFTGIEYGDHWRSHGCYPEPESDDSTAESDVPANFSFGKRTKASVSREGFSCPAPAAYCHLERKHAGPAFSLGGRGSSDNSCPGVVHSQRSSRSSSPAFSFSGRMGPQREREDSPGPRAYHLHDAALHRRDFHMLDRIDRRKGDDCPGPGSYDPVHGVRSTSQSSPAYTIGWKVCKDQMPSQTPGPGSYGGLTQLYSTPAFSFSGRQLRTPVGRCDPGPGAYDPETRLVSSIAPAFSMAAALPASTPGPGAYSPQQPPSSSPTFSISGKLRSMSPLGTAASSPGPGTYTSPSQNQPSSASFSFGRRMIPQQREHLPGPGNYVNLNLSSQSPAYTIGMKRSAGKQEQIPGPGAYESISRSSSPSFSIAARIPMVQSPSSSPGPGEYSPSSKTSGPAFIIGNKLEKHGTVVDPTPGPGAYSPSLNQVSSNPPAFSLSGKWRKTKDLAGKSPGPGSYTPATRPDSPSYTIKARIDAPQKTDCSILGPGSYHVKSRSSSPAYSLARKFSSSKTHGADIPGPGRYSPPCRPDSPSYSIGGRIHTKKGDSFPGPGAYDVGSRPSSPAFSLGNRLGKTLFNDNPGPGSYHAKAYPANPAFSIGGKHLGFMRLDQTPGPGDYEIVNNCVGKDCSPSFTFGSRTNHADRSAARSPGPGAYSSSFSTLKGLSFSFGGKPRDCSPDMSPGPGAYSAGIDPTVLKAPAFGFGRRLEKRSRQDETPGPGAYSYDLQKVKDAAPAYSLHRRIECARRDLSPGPGSYDLNLSCSVPAAPAFSLAGQLRPSPAGDASASPGPGTYSISSFLPQSSPSYTMAAKKSMSMQERTPGPGDYNPIISRSSSPSFSIAARLKDNIHIRSCSSSPGPGAYSSSAMPSGLAFTLGQKLQKFSGDSTIPGPGAYSPSAHPISSTPPAFSLAGRLRSAGKLTDTPGPGAYSPHQSPGSPSYSFKLRIDPRKQDSFPGPGAYQVGSRSTSPSFSLGNRMGMASSTFNETPGPGAYDIATVKPASPAYSIGGRPANLRLDQTPGPGDYSHSYGCVARDSPSLTFGHRTHDYSSRADAGGPGPAAYSIPTTLSKLSFSFPCRPKSCPSSITPGPGSYDTKSHLIMHKSPTFDLGRRLNNPHRDQSPGPGAYSFHRVSDAPAYSLSGRIKAISRESTPGPGYYAVRISSSSPAVPAFSLGSRLLPQNGDDSITPGPDHYNICSFFSQSPAYTMGMKSLMSKQETAPGPGAHNPVLGSSSPSFSMAARLSDTFIRSSCSSPGPGAYYIRENSCGPSFILGRKLQKFSGDSTPGPGAYSPDIDFISWSPPAFSLAGKLNRS